MSVVLYNFIRKRTTEFYARNIQHDCGSSSAVAEYMIDIQEICIHLHSPHNMVAQANETGTSKNTTNEKEK